MDFLLGREGLRRGLFALVEVLTLFPRLGEKFVAELGGVDDSVSLVVLRQLLPIADNTSVNWRYKRLNVPLNEMTIGFHGPLVNWNQLVGFAALTGL